MITIDRDLTGTAKASADRAARRSGVRTRKLIGGADFAIAAQLFDHVWGAEETSLVGPTLLHAHGMAGSSIVGAFDGEVLIGASLAMWGRPSRPAMHSHLTAVSPRARGRDVGFALKLFQRAEALAGGAEVITWTFDPLVARNAHFNLGKLGASARKYVVNQYGAQHDAINAGDVTDRVVVEWELGRGRTRLACGDGSAAPAAVQRPVGDAAGELIEIPADIEALRRTNPAAAAGWRSRLRTKLKPAINSGVEVEFVHGGYRIRPMAR